VGKLRQVGSKAVPLAGQDFAVWINEQDEIGFGIGKQVCQNDGDAPRTVLA
jgi:hypothetical protein